MDKISDSTKVYQPTTVTTTEEDENSCCESESDVAAGVRAPYESTRFESGFSSAGTFQASQSSSYSEDKMRRRLQFFFMNPIEKWKARRKFPYKFFVQVSFIFIYLLYLRYEHLTLDRIRGRTFAGLRCHVRLWREHTM